MRQKPLSRKLKHNKTTRYPQYFCFVDTETLLEKKDNEETLHHFRLGVAIFARFRKDSDKITQHVYSFNNVQTFWEKVISFVSGKNTLHIIAHNALFDMTVLKHRTILTELGFDCTFMFEDGFIFISKWVRGDQRLMVLDNANWFKGKLEKWGDKLGLAKLKMPEFSAPDKEWFVYCERDTEILFELQKWFIKFLVDNDLGNWKYTLASTSFNSYRHRFMRHPIYIPERSRETYLARNSYKGGRTECFRIGEYDNGTFYKLDINSHYPSVMLNNHFPTAVEGYIRNPKKETITRHIMAGGCIASVHLNCEEPYFPIINNTKTCYPIGSFNATLTTGELAFALSQGWVTDIYEAALYRMRPIFTDFVDFFYNERLKWIEKNDELRSLLFKIMLNSLYGKFGQRGFHDKIIGQQEPGTWETSFFIDRVSGDKGLIRQIGRNVIKSSKKGEGYNAFVAIASHVTGYARIDLYNLILCAGRENTYYCDTDSLIVNGVGLRRLDKFIQPGKLGMLKLEGTSNELSIVAPKHYEFDGQWTIKGIKKNAEKVGQNTYRQEIWPGLNKILQRRNEAYYNYTQTKTLSAKITSGNIMSDGRVEPFVLNDGR